MCTHCVPNNILWWNITLSKLEKIFNKFNKFVYIDKKILIHMIWESPSADSEQVRKCEQIYFSCLILQDKAHCQWLNSFDVSDSLED